MPLKLDDSKYFMTPSEGEGSVFVFSTCAAECGNVLGPYPKVIETGPTVLTTSWSCGIGDGVPGGRSVRTPTLPRQGVAWFWVVLCGFMWFDVVLCGVTWFDVILCGLT